MIEVICGPMFSGKTEELIRRIKRVHIAGLECAVVKYDSKNRYQEEYTGIVSHDKKSYFVATPITSTLNLYDYSQDVIAIDEVQFFPDYLFKVIQNLSDCGKRIIVSGLDMDYLRQPFPTMANIIAVADTVDKLKSICMECKGDALYSFRTTNETELMVIGEKDSYMPLCIKCYNKKNDERNT